MKKIFNTPITSRRHRELGFCEENDFANLDLVSIPEEEKALIVKFKIDSTETEYIEFNNEVYIKINSDNNVFPFSREEDAEWIKKQGKFTEKECIKLMLKLREPMEKSYSCIDSKKYILIGRTLYYKYCKIEELNITVCGNLTFSCWLSIDIERTHDGKSNIPLTKTNLLKTIKEKKIAFNKAKTNSFNVDNHISFSCPTNTKWGNIKNN